MSKRDPSNSESQTEESGSSTEEPSSEEAEVDGIGSSVCNAGNEGILSEYEKQRLARIAGNRARMEALGLHKMASSLMASVKKVTNQTQKSTQRKGKLKSVDDDEDYKPIDDDDASDDDQDADNDDDFVGSPSYSKARRNKGCSSKKRAKPNKEVSAQKHNSSADYIEDEDEFMQAIALSLQDTAVKERKETSYIDVDAGRKSKISFTSRVKMTEDELILHFFQFDESGHGTIRIRDLERVAIAHDFTWTDKELADMIRYFDSDGDGKLNLDDFRKIVGRCNMIQGSDN